MQIARSLHRIGSPIVNSYLIVDSGGVTIIDAGLPGYWKLLAAELAVIGKTLNDVRALVLTDPRCSSTARSRSANRRCSHSSLTIARRQRRTG